LNQAIDPAAGNIVVRGTRLYLSQALAARCPKDRGECGRPLAHFVKLIDEVMSLERGSIKYTVVEGNSRMRWTTP
jgi:hypothetical protein